MQRLANYISESQTINERATYKQVMSVNKAIDFTQEIKFYLGDESNGTFEKQADVMFDDFKMRKIYTTIKTIVDAVKNSNITINNMFQSCFISLDYDRRGYTTLSINCKRGEDFSVLKMEFTQYDGEPVVGKISGSFVPNDEQGEIDSSRYNGVLNCILEMLEHYLIKNR